MPHQKVQVVIFAASGQVLLLQTTTLRGSFWQNVTGSVEPGENTPAAAARELREETSFNTPVRSTQYQFDFEHACYQDPQQMEICREEVFYTLLPAAAIPSLDPLEHQNFAWQELTKMAPANYKFNTSWMAFTSAYECCRREHPDLPWPPNLKISG